MSCFLFDDLNFVSVTNRRARKTHKYGPDVIRAYSWDRDHFRYAFCYRHIGMRVDWERFSGGMAAQQREKRPTRVSVLHGFKTSKLHMGVRSVSFVFSQASRPHPYAR
jgi:hypothetical protein